MYKVPIYIAMTINSFPELGIRSPESWIQSFMII